MRTLRSAVALVAATFTLFAGQGVADAALPSSIKLDVAPTTVTWGSPSVVSGSLQCAGLGAAGVPVIIKHAATVGAAPADAVVFTGRDGNFRTAELPAKATIVRAVFPGSATCAPAQTAWIWINVRADVGLHAPSGAIFGTPAVLTGSVLPAHAGHRVELQVLDGASRRWRFVATGRLDGASRFRFSYTNFVTPGFLVYRVLFSSDIDHVWNSSRSVRVDWTGTPVVLPTPFVSTVAAVKPVVAPAPKHGHCNPNYAGACLDKRGDYDCRGGTGNGPNFIGRIRVVGVDEYNLDADGDRIGCE